jgi:hypothetical protein
MNVQSGNSGPLRRYLLGELSEQEREQVEQRLMSDDDLYQQLLLAEDDLVDEYISNALPEQDRAKFSQNFLNVPELRQDVRFALVLRKHVLETAPKAVAKDSPVVPHVSLRDRFRNFFLQPALGVSFAVALLAAVLLVAWLAAQNSRLRKQVEQLQAQQTPLPTLERDLQAQLASERLRNEQLSSELLRQQELLAEETRKLQLAQEQQPSIPTPRPVSQSTVTTFVALTLTPGLVRDSGELKKVSVPPNTREVRISLDLPESGYRSYSTVLTTVEGREVWSRQGLQATGRKFVLAIIPAKFLSPDDYQMLLSGVKRSGESEEISRYYFRVLP